MPWCALFEAGDTTIRATAAINVVSMQSLLELHYEEAGTYAGADLRERFGTGTGPGEAVIARASTASYCVESTVGYLTGPEPSEPTPGPC